MWRVTVTTADNLTYEHGFLRLRDNEAAIKYSIGGPSSPAARSP